MAKVLSKLGDDVSTDIIYPGRYMATVLPTETPQFAFADMADLNKQLNSADGVKGSVLIGGNNFGCGSSREQAASCLKGHELTIIAKDISRIFMQNAINLGLNVVICPSIEAEEGDDVEVHGNQVANKTRGTTYPIEPLPQSRQAIIDAGGLIAFTRQRLLKRT